MRTAGSPSPASRPPSTRTQPRSPIPKPKQPPRDHVTHLDHEATPLDERHTGAMNSYRLRPPRPRPTASQIIDKVIAPLLHLTAEQRMGSASLACDDPPVASTGGSWGTNCFKILTQSCTTAAKPAPARKLRRQRQSAAVRAAGDPRLADDHPRAANLNNALPSVTHTRDGSAGQKHRLGASCVSDGARV